MTHRRMYITARNLEAARSIASRTGVLSVRSGKWVSSKPLREGNLRTYSFQYKE